MSRLRAMVRRTGLVVTGAVAAVVLLDGVASAHVTVVSPDNPAKGGDAEIVLRTPNESDSASLVKVELDVPAATPLSNASPQPVPGWATQVNMSNLKTPVKMAHDTVTQAVASIVWTAQPGQGTPANDFQSFSFWSEGLPDNADSIMFTAVQTYSDGSVVTWNQPMGADGGEPEHPAPTLALASGDPMSSSSSSSNSGSASATDNTARWLGIGGLALGVIGIGFGLARGRRRSGA